MKSINNMSQAPVNDYFIVSMLRGKGIGYKSIGDWQAPGEEDVPGENFEYTNIWIYNMTIYSPNETNR